MTIILDKKIMDMTNEEVRLLSWYMSNPVCGPFRYEIFYNVENEHYVVYSNGGKNENKICR